MPRNKYPEQTVEKILDAAAALFAEKGYQSTTLQDIIDATGLSKGAVYHHFRSKEEIARKVGDRMGDEMWEPLRRIRDAIPMVTDRYADYKTDGLADAWAKMMLDRSGVDVPETKEKL